MSFELKTLEQEDQDLIYETVNQAKMLDEVRSIFWKKESIGNEEVVVDKIRGIFLFFHRIDREDGRRRYVFGVDRSVAIIFEIGECLYSIERISCGLFDRISEVKEFISEIFIQFGADLNESNSKSGGNDVQAVKIESNFGGAKREAIHLGEAKEK